jgi:hypothetical protein
MDGKDCLIFAGGIILIIAGSPIVGTCLIVFALFF